LGTNQFHIPENPLNQSNRSFSFFSPYFSNGCAFLILASLSGLLLLLLLRFALPIGN
jgi:hypothetical protein